MHNYCYLFLNVCKKHVYTFCSMLFLFVLFEFFCGFLFKKVCVRESKSLYTNLSKQSKTKK